MNRTDAPSGPHGSNRNTGPSVAELRVYYAAATVVIPYRVFDHCELFVKEALSAPSDTVANILLQASLQIRVGIPDWERKLHIDTGREYLEQFNLVSGDLTPQTKYIVIPFPKPPPVILRWTDGFPVCGVFFVGVVYSPTDFSTRCYVLRPSMPGSPDPTTLRELLKDGTNLNLGGGCRPNTDAFIELLRRVESGDKVVYGMV